MAVLYSNLAYAYFGDKKYEQSLVAFHQALTIDPKFFEQWLEKWFGVARSVGDRSRAFLLHAGEVICAGREY
jgi:tetratricopeptide (TPR) repeat protein